MPIVSLYVNKIKQLPYMLERAPWALLSYLPETVGGLSRVGAFSRVGGLSRVGALSRVGSLSTLGALSSVYGKLKNKIQPASWS